MRLPLLLGAFPFLTSCLLAQDVPPSVKPATKVNYPANFQVAEGIDLFVFGDYLYWDASEDGLYYAQHQKGSVQGSLKKIKPDYDSGLRVGLGLNFPKEGYDVSASWTWFETQAESHAKGTLIPLWAEPDFSTFATASSAKGNWDLDLNLLDLTWGRTSWFGGNFSLKPFMGLRGAQINQKLINHFIYTTAPVTQGKLEAHSNFEGGGLRAGAEGRFTFAHGFALCGATSGSLLYGRFNADASTKEDAVTIAKTADHFYQTSPSLQMALALSWDTHCAKDKLHIEFHLGWEQNLWFGLNKMNHYVNQLRQGLFFQEKGNLGLQGLIAGGRFDF